MKKSSRDLTFKVTRKKRLPFEFVFDYLEGLPTTVKPMFGCHAIYLGPKIVLILRERESARDDNGVWIATTKEHHASLQKEFPSMRSIGLFGTGPTGWQVLPADSLDFEESVTRACELIRQQDPRIGKIPKGKKKKRKGS